MQKFSILKDLLDELEGMACIAALSPQPAHKFDYVAHVGGGKYTLKLALCPDVIRGKIKQLKRTKASLARWRSRNKPTRYAKI